MFYRVVMQGRALGGADIGEVKRHFVRVTGLPVTVAEQLFGGMPQVIKRRVAQTDAERIAATLRAIGAAATVEIEPPGTEDETPEEIRMVAHPFNHGPPTIIPGSMAPPDSTPAPSRHARWLRTLRSKKWSLLRDAALLVAGAVLLAPIADSLLETTRPTPAPARVAPKRPAATVPSAPVMTATLLHGPWRCTDQRTGVSTYWSYGANGVLTFHGDVLSDGPAPSGAATSAPTGWNLEGQRLSHTFAQRVPDTYTVAELTLARLRYGDERELDIECRRP